MGFYFYSGTINGITDIDIGHTQSGEFTAGLRFAKGFNRWWCLAGDELSSSAPTRYSKFIQAIREQRLPSRCACLAQGVNKGEIPPKVPDLPQLDSGSRDG